MRALIPSDTYAEIAKLRRKLQELTAEVERLRQQIDNRDSQMEDVAWAIARYRRLAYHVIETLGDSDSPEHKALVSEAHKAIGEGE